MFPTRRKKFKKLSVKNQTHWMLKKNIWIVMKRDKEMKTTVLTDQAILIPQWMIISIRAVQELTVRVFLILRQTKKPIKSRMISERAALLKRWRIPVQVET